MRIVGGIRFREARFSGSAVWTTVYPIASELRFRENGSRAGTLSPMFPWSISLAWWTLWRWTLGGEAIAGCVWKASLPLPTGSISLNWGSISSTPCFHETYHLRWNEFRRHSIRSTVVNPRIIAGSHPFQTEQKVVFYPTSICGGRLSAC